MAATPGGTMPAPEEHLFRYGSRTVRRRKDDGSYELLQLPLTLWDLLHPQEGDQPMQGLRHSKEVVYLWTVIGDRIKGDPHALALQDTAVYWDTPGIGHHSPDVTVIFNIDRPRDDWPSFYVSREGVRPSLIIEVVSPPSRQNDVVTKLDEYHRGLLPVYIIVDREREEDPPTLLGYRFTPERYEPIPLDAQGRLPLEAVGLLLGTKEGRIVLHDAASGAELGDYSALSARLEAEAKARKAAEEQAAEERKRAELAQGLAEEAAKRAEEAEEEARKDRLAREKAEEKARSAAADREKAVEAARSAATDREKAEEAARSAAADREKAEEATRQARQAQVDLERQVRELLARLQDQPPPAPTA
jgi:Uma2 family endonuclease